MNSSVLVLGAGMVGTCTALHLVLKGHAVTLIDRREPGRETSYGNAGIIQREAVEPYPFPRDFATLLRVAFKRGADVNYHFAAMPGLAGSLARYWFNSAAKRYAAIASDYTRLIEHSTSGHAQLLQMAGAQDLVNQSGFRFVFRDPANLDRALATARRLQTTHGLRHQALDGGALAAVEPALRVRLAGALHWLDPWSVTDPGELVGRYAALFTRLGGTLARGDGRTLRSTVNGWQVVTEGGTLDAEHAVIALGPWSDTVLRPLGYSMPLFVKRGYHRHYRGATGPQLPLFDVDRSLVIAPMKRGIRITTGAEFARLDAAATPLQMGKAEISARELFELPEPVEATPWLGARPCTADMKPVIGAAPRHRGLWFNFGHAHQGFTLGPISGRLLAELLSGEKPVLDPTPYSAERFG